MALVYLVEGNRDGGDKIQVEQGPCSESFRASIRVFIWKLIVHWSIYFANLVPNFLLCSSLLKFTNTQEECISCIALLFWPGDVDICRDLRKNVLKDELLQTSQKLSCLFGALRLEHSPEEHAENFAVNLMGQH